MNINKTKSRYIAITDRKDECVNISDVTLSVASSRCSNHLDERCTNDCESGIVFLLFGRYYNK